MTKWEYCAMVFPAGILPEDMADKMTMMGGAGWRTIHIHHHSWGATVYFERQVQEEGR